MDNIVDLERMRMLDSMRRDGTSLFERASANFTANAPDQLGEIRAAVDAADATALVATAHKLKGSAANLGLPLVGEAAFALENLGDTGTTDGADELLATLERGARPRPGRAGRAGRTRPVSRAPALTSE